MAGLPAKSEAADTRTPGDGPGTDLPPGEDPEVEAAEASPGFCDRCWDPCRPEQRSRRRGTARDPVSPMDFCDGRVPFPCSLGLHPDWPEAGIRTLRLSEGHWEYSEDVDQVFLTHAQVDLFDVLAVDVDRDGRKEGIAVFMTNHGGNVTFFHTLAYEHRGGRPRFIGVLDETTDVESDVEGLEAYGPHCVKIVGQCDKHCHACPGRNCYKVVSWDGREFQVAAETRFTGDPANGDEPMEQTLDGRLLSLCWALDRLRK